MNSCPESRQLRMSSVLPGCMESLLLTGWENHGNIMLQGSKSHVTRNEPRKFSPSERGRGGQKQGCIRERDPEVGKRSLKPSSHMAAAGSGELDLDCDKATHNELDSQPDFCFQSV